MLIGWLPPTYFDAAIELWHEVGLTRPWNDPSRDLDRAVTSSASTVLAGIREETLLATAMVGHDGHRGWVYYLAVTASARGRGHGRAMMRACEAWLAERHVEEALRESGDEVPDFRGFVRVCGTGGVATHLATPGQAAEAAHLTVEAIHAARREWLDIRRTHLFLAGPTGLAVLLGQLLNGLGVVQTYEHVPDDALGTYRRAALLRPGA